MERREEGVRSEGKRESEHQSLCSTTLTVGDEARRERPLVADRRPLEAVWGTDKESKASLSPARKGGGRSISASRSGCRGVGASRIHFESEATING